MTAGNILETSVADDELSASINMVANGVLVTDACVAAISDMTATGETDAGRNDERRATAA